MKQADSGGCNGGWLGELEERVKSLMAAFASNTPVILDVEQQADLVLADVRLQEHGRPPFL